MPADRGTQYESICYTERLAVAGIEPSVGSVVTPNGSMVPGPAVPWKGRRHGPRRDRR